PFGGVAAAAAWPWRGHGAPPGRAGGRDDGGAAGPGDRRGNPLLSGALPPPGVRRAVARAAARGAPPARRADGFGSAVATGGAIGDDRDRRGRARRGDRLRRRPPSDPRGGGAQPARGRVRVL